MRDAFFCLFLFMVILLLFFILTPILGTKAVNSKSPYATEWEEIGSNAYRLENKEVICYGANGSGVSCKWKERGQ